MVAGTFGFVNFGAIKRRDMAVSCWSMLTGNMSGERALSCEVDQGRCCRRPPNIPGHQLGKLLMNRSSRAEEGLYVRLFPWQFLLLLVRGRGCGLIGSLGGRNLEEGQTQKSPAP